MAPRSEGRTQPLSEAHDALGASWIDFDGQRAPGRYTTVEAEHAALTAGQGLVDRSFVDTLEVTGEDRHRFLNGYTSCEVAGLEAGRSTFGFLTTAQGRILADVMVFSLAQSFLLELPAGRAEEVARHLARYVIADRVEIRPGRLVPLTLFGAPGAGAAPILATSRDLPGDWEVAELELWGLEVVVEQRPLWGLSALSVWVEPEAAVALWRRLLEAGRGHGLEPVGLEALEICRVERGVPRFGLDFGPDHFPQETGLEEQAVSYTKGCYLGQEVVARIHYRGKVNRGLVGLLLETAVPRGTELLLDGRAVGTMGGAVDSVALGHPVGLAILHRRGCEPGTRLEVAGGGSAEVVSLPFAGP